MFFRSQGIHRATGCEEIEDDARTYTYEHTLIEAVLETGQISDHTSWATRASRAGRVVFRANLDDRQDRVILYW